ncbi:MAG TPA: NADH:flavin oxidoreductase/NADH oxidase [Vicinamibacterales bacterium]|nr:NADH:flavin oxidoreductase/NADH oxidase [Vicinamibacterales bacterium]
MPHLFEPLQLRGLTLRNRIVVSPMCQYSCNEGFANDWHFVHLASRAVGGAGLVFTEAAAVTADGRISPEDLGIWDDVHAGPFERIGRFVRGEGAAFGMQLAHAGRKGSTRRPWDGTGAVSPEEGGWQPSGPTATPFADNYPVPRMMTRDDIVEVIDAFRRAAYRARRVGFDVVEVHAAHGYLIHEFLSPLSNTRTDQYGGSFDNRIRLCVEVVEAVRGVWPDDRPLFVRVSATDWTEGGWDIEQAVELARRLRALGVDLVDCSSGGNVPNARIPLGPGYQVPFAERIRRDAAIPTGAVGLITQPAEADAIVRGGQADLVLLARELLRDPYWPLRAARELGHEVSWPSQYLRAAPPHSPGR